MLPATEYQALIRTAQLKIAAFLFIAFLATLVSVLWCSKKYVAPILQGLEQIKTSTDRAQGDPTFWKSRISLLSSQSRTGHMRQLYPLYSRSGWKRRVGRSGCKANWNRPAMILDLRRQKLPGLPIPENRRSIPMIFNISGRGSVSSLRQKGRSLICILKEKCKRDSCDPGRDRKHIKIPQQKYLQQAGRFIPQTAPSLCHFTEAAGGKGTAITFPHTGTHSTPARYSRTPLAIPPASRFW